MLSASCVPRAVAVALVAVWMIFKESCIKSIAVGMTTIEMTMISKMSSIKVKDFLVLGKEFLILDKIFIYSSAFL
jgi:hypothetical protein